MKAFKYFLSAVFIFTAIWSCTDEEFGSTDFVSTTVAPENVSALFSVTQDNTGVVSITPNSDGAVSYDVYFGDNTDPVKVKQGETVTHTYPEGNYDVKIVAYGITGLKTEVTKPLVVSFNAPENLVVTIENDLAVSKQVNVTATADWAITFDVYFGEPGNDTPVTGNIGETVSYIYTEPGTYTIRVVAKGAAIATAEYTEDFEATAIIQPITSAPTPPNRSEEDYVSIFSSVYTDEPDVDYFPDWGQAGQGSSWGTFDLNGDAMLQYINLSYQGIQFGAVDVSAMEFFHMDVWTADLPKIETSLISETNGEKAVWSDLTVDEWTSIDIPISAFTDQGLTVADIFQLKFVGDPWAGGTVFIDNIYFYKSPPNCAMEVDENIDPAMGDLNWTFKTNDAAHAFEPFGNIGSSIVENPLVDEFNESCNVQSYIKTAGCETWSGVGKGLANSIDLTSSPNKVFKMKVFAQDHVTEVTLRLEFEPYPNVDPAVDVVQTMTKVGEWEELTFDFSAHSDKTFKSIIVYFDRNNACDEATYYFDDIIQVQGDLSAGLSLPFDFESSPVTADFINFDGGAVTVMSNPQSSGINTSGTVAQMIRNGGAVWAGSKIVLSNKLDFSSQAGISMKVFTTAPIGTNVTFKLEDSTDGGINAEVAAVTTVTGEWETLTWDFIGKPSNTYDALVFLFDLGNVGNGSANSTFLFDDIQQVDLTGGNSQIDLPVDFESSTVDYTLTDFGGNASSLVADPENASNTVAQAIKTDTGATWAGTTIGTNAGFATNIPITLTNSKMTVRVWSPDAGTPIRLKIEDANDATHTCETEVNTTVASGWETLEFDFTNQATGTELLSVGLGNGWVYNKASIFFNFGTEGATAGEKTYYFDDVIFITN